MSAKIIRLFLLLIFAAVQHGCSKSNPVNPSIGGNLLTNPSFELNGTPSLQGWRTSYTNTSIFSFSSDAPSGGGKYSISIEVLWAPPYTVKQTVPAIAGNHQYRLSVWGKKSEIVGGNLSFYLRRPDSTLLRKWVRIVDTTWTEYSIIDTLYAVSGDSLMVSVDGGFSQIRPGKTFYDLCTLEQIK